MLVLFVRLACGAALFCACTPASPPIAPTVHVDVPPMPSRARGGPSRSAGDHVEVEWHGTWYRAVLLEARGEEWLIHYEGYDASDDEVVAPRRIRDAKAHVDEPEGDFVVEEEP